MSTDIFVCAELHLQQFLSRGSLKRNEHARSSDIRAHKMKGMSISVSAKRPNLIVTAI